MPASYARHEGSSWRGKQGRKCGIPRGSRSRGEGAVGRILSGQVSALLAAYQAAKGQSAPQDVQDVGAAGQTVQGLSQVLTNAGFPPSPTGAPNQPAVPTSGG